MPFRLPISYLPRKHTVAAILSDGSNRLAECIVTIIETPARLLVNWVDKRKAVTGSFEAWFANAFLLLCFFIGVCIKIIVGIMAAFADLLCSFSLRALMGIASIILTALIAPLALTVAFIQHLCSLQSRPRPLSVKEQQELHKIFGRSLNCASIRIIEKNHGWFRLIPASFAISRLLYCKRSDIGTLIHECVHTWQCQHYGIRYIGDALLAQWIAGRKAGYHDAYDWKHLALAADNQFRNLNAEAQAQCVEDNRMDFESRILTGMFMRLREDTFRTIHC